MGDKLFSVKACSLVGMLTTALMGVLVYNVHDVLNRLDRLECNTQRILVKIGLEPVVVVGQHNQVLPVQSGENRAENRCLWESTKSHGGKSAYVNVGKKTKKNLANPDSDSIIGAALVENE